MMSTPWSSQRHSCCRWLKFHYILSRGKKTNTDTDRQVTIRRSIRGRIFIPYWVPSALELSHVIKFVGSHLRRHGTACLHWQGISFEYYVNKRSADRVAWIINVLATQINLHQSHPVFCCFVLARNSQSPTHRGPVKQLKCAQIQVQGDAIIVGQISILEQCAAVVAYMAMHWSASKAESELPLYVKDKTLQWLSQF